MHFLKWFDQTKQKHWTPIKCNHKKCLVINAGWIFYIMREREKRHREKKNKERKTE